MKRILLLALLATPAAAQPQDKATPLFRDEAPLAVTLSGPIRRLAAKAPHSTEPAAGTLEAAGETHAIALSARGVSRRRRETCRFPPLRVALASKPDRTSLFFRQSGLKLVTHCNAAERFDQHLLREYAAYRLYNVITPDSFRVRLLRVSYQETGKLLATRWGFFIEDADDVARRLGRRELTTGKIERTALDAQAAARLSLFQYMIGNTDWDMTAGPHGRDCCHNVKLLAADRGEAGKLVPLPYDFDASGLVDAPYAVPHEALPIRHVRQRHYRGYCILNAQLLAEAETFRQARPEMLGVLAGVPGLTDASRQTMRTYIDAFFTDIATPASMAQTLLSNCR